MHGALALELGLRMRKKRPNLFQMNVFNQAMEENVIEGIGLDQEQMGEAEEDFSLEKLVSMSH
jgi:hypothetical protein